MFKRELKCNFKNFMIWTIIILVLFGVVFAIYPSIASSDNIKSIDELAQIFPPEILSAFNMDIASLSTMFGWLKSEGFVMILLIVGVYAGILGSNILVKEENDKTIEYLNSLPISREKIVLSKAFVGIIYILLITITIAIFNYIGLELSGDYNREQYLLMSITPIFSSLVIYSLCLFISTFTHKTKNTLGLSLGIVFISFIFNAISGIDKSVAWLKYISVFTLSDIRNVILNIEVNPIMIIISFLITSVFILLSTINYKRKNLV